MHRIGRINTDEAAVPPDHLVPGRAAGVLFGAVVLAAAEGNVGVGRVDGNAGELGDLQVAIEIGPVDHAHVGVVQAPNAAVIAVHQQTVVVEIDGVVVRVRPLAV